MSKKDEFDVAFSSFVGTHNCKCHAGKFSVNVEIVEPSGKTKIIAQKFYDSELEAQKDQEKFADDTARSFIKNMGFAVLGAEPTVTGEAAEKRFQRYANDNNPNLH